MTRSTDPGHRRSPDLVMSLARMGANWPTKFSFSQSFLHTVSRAQFACRTRDIDLDGEGRGRIVYEVSVAGERLSFAVFSDPMPESEQQDRIIATRWDAWAALFLGTPSEADLEQSRVEVQKVTWGRAAPRTVAWSRANRSARLFSHVVESLAAGVQPSIRQINEVGYLIRTTGFSGNGRNGMKDFAYLRDIGHPLRAPYHVQMLAAYLWREFGLDLVAHLARVRNPGAIALSPQIRRFIGVGNSSGIGLVPFVVRHPRLVDRWIEAREEELARLKAAGFDARDRRCDLFADQLGRAARYLSFEPLGDFDEFVPASEVASELRRLDADFSRLRRDEAWDGARFANPVAALLAGAAASATEETQELLNALALEVQDPDREVEHDLTADEGLGFAPDMHAGELLAAARQGFIWAKALAGGPERPFFWYASEENMEPRRGRAGVDEGEQYALPVDVVGRLDELIARLQGVAPTLSLGRFVFQYPDMRFMVAWTATLVHTAYAVARTDLLSSDFSPLRLMRFQLAIYGMLKFRPRSRTWLRATLFQGAALPEELAAGDPGDGLFPNVDSFAIESIAREEILGE